MRPGGLDGSNLAILNREDLRKVVDVPENKFQVLHLADTAQKIDAAAAETGGGWSITPAAHDRGRLRTGGHEAAAEKRGGDPGTADLILLAKLTFRARANDSHAFVMEGQVTGEGGVTAKARQIDGIASGRGLNDLSARRGDQDERPVRVAAAGELGRTVIHFEGGRHRAVRLAGQERVVESRRDRQGSFHARRRKTAAAGCGSGDRSRGGANHVDDDDGPSIAVSGCAFGEAIDDDRLSHSVPARSHDALARGTGSSLGRRFSFRNASEWRPRR